MPTRFSKDEDATEIIQFSFLNPEGRVTRSSLKAAFTPPYPPKYYLNISLTVLGLIVFLLWNYGVIPGNKFGFFCNDPLFSHKYRGDTITPPVLGVGIAFLFPFLYFTTECIRQENCKDVFTLQSLFEFYVYMKQFTIGLILVGGATEIAKTIVGEHRPHFFDTCMPDTNFNCTNGTYIFDFTCTNRNVSLIDKTDSSRSFPSGHSSMSWFTTLYCGYIIHSRLPINRTGTALKILMIAISVTFGLTCSLTRITDRRHHWWDVLAGTIIGFLGAAYIIKMTHQQVRFLYKQVVCSEKQNTCDIEIEQSC